MGSGPGPSAPWPPSARKLNTSQRYLHVHLYMHMYIYLYMCCRNAWKVSVSHTGCDLTLPLMLQYKLANDQELVGKFDHALPNYLRAKEVMVRTTGGPHSDYSSMVAMRIGKLYCSMGRYKDAVESLGDIEKYPDNHFKVHAHQCKLD